MDGRRIRWGESHAFAASNPAAASRVTLPYGGRAGLRTIGSFRNNPSPRGRGNASLSGERGVGHARGVFAMPQAIEIRPASGRLGILTPGMGAVATTTYAGILAVRQGRAKPIGSLTQMGRIRLGKRTEHRNPLIKDFVPLAGLDDLVFGGWDPFPDNAFEAACKAGVLSVADLLPLRDELDAIRPMPAVFDRAYVRNLDGSNVKHGETKMDLAQQIMEDMQRFKEEQRCDRLVVVWCASTEIFAEPAEVHRSLEAFE